MKQLFDKLQGWLSFSGCTNHQFIENGIGKIGTTGFVVGFLGGFHLALFFCASFCQMYIFNSTAVQIVTIWSAYFTLLCAYHFLEFFITAVKQPDVVSYESFVVNHGNNYSMAVLACWSEFWLESWLFPSLKAHRMLFVIGLVVGFIGFLIRCIAMWTCGENFSHQIRHEKIESHKLVNHGVYAYLRHPAYFGWFYFSVGTQIILLNPVCLVLYTLMSWKFFAERIPYEERLLRKFFGEEYQIYCKRTIIGIPLIPSSDL